MALADLTALSELAREYAAKHDALVTAAQDVAQPERKLAALMKDSFTHRVCVRVGDRTWLVTYNQGTGAVECSAVTLL